MGEQGYAILAPEVVDRQLFIRAVAFQDVAPESLPVLESALVEAKGVGAWSEASWKDPVVELADLGVDHGDLRLSHRSLGCTAYGLSVTKSSAKHCTANTIRFIV